MIFFSSDDPLTAKGYLAGVKVFLNSVTRFTIIKTFASYAYRAEIDDTVTIIPVDPPTEVHTIILKKERIDPRNVDEYILSFCELEAWG